VKTRPFSARPLRAATAVFAGLSFVAMAYHVWVPVADYDLWWHLASGREMFSSHHLLRSDIFSHPMAGTPWINFEWLGQLFLYAVASACGLSALFYLKVAGILTVLTGVAILLRVAGATGSLWLLGLWTSFVVLRPRLLDRLELLSLFLMTVFVTSFLIVRRSSAARRWAPWILGALMILWCNFHGGWVYGLGAAILFNLGARWSQEPADVRRG
jgi:hypothetical protein